MEEKRKLPMDDGEIVLDYKRAIDKRKQIRILAELNATSQGMIVGILEQHGITDLPELKGVRKRLPFRIGKELPVTIAGDGATEEIPETPTVSNEECAEEREEECAKGATYAPWARAALLCGMIRENDSKAVKNSIIALAAELFLADASATYAEGGANADR